jgi:GTP-binding protein
MFLDEAVVEFNSGRGGSGAVGFHREKHVPRGGPNGADGGRGGDIVLLADRHKRTLYDFKLQSRFKAEDGVHGVGNKRGKDGKPIEIKVPVGTVVTDDETGDIVVDLNRHGMKFVLCKGGKGGFGNQHYTTSVKQAPNFAQKGAPGETIRARLELKLVADVALIGLPNAGKSTLISRISAAKPKIADYPFTTIVPNLGVVRYHHETFVVADMPGLIEGASDGIGLGHQFLKHVERTRVLVHVVDCFPVDESDPIANFHLIENELRLYSEEIWKRPRIIALNKVDIVPPDKYNEIRRQFEEIVSHPGELDIRGMMPISGVTGQGLDALLDLVWGALETVEEEVPIPILLPAKGRSEETPFEIKQDEDGYIVSGKRIERLVAMTDMESDEAVRYLHRRLERIGLIDRLRQMGASEGDSVVVGDFEFSFTDEL